jgi:hypothetical protein
LISQPRALPTAEETSGRTVGGLVKRFEATFVMGLGANSCLFCSGEESPRLFDFKNALFETRDAARAGAASLGRRALDSCSSAMHRRLVPAADRAPTSMGGLLALRNCCETRRRLRSGSAPHTFHVSVILHFNCCRVVASRCGSLPTSTTQLGPSDQERHKLSGSTETLFGNRAPSLPSQQPDPLSSIPPTGLITPALPTSVASHPSLRSPARFLFSSAFRFNPALPALDCGLAWLHTTIAIGYCSSFGLSGKRSEPDARPT